MIVNWHGWKIIFQSSVIIIPLKMVFGYVKEMRHYNCNEIRDCELMLQTTSQYSTSNTNLDCPAASKYFIEYAIECRNWFRVITSVSLSFAIIEPKHQWMNLTEHEFLITFNPDFMHCDNQKCDTPRNPHWIWAHRNGNTENLTKT